MLQNYFKIGFRNLLKNKIFSGINILGLAIAIAASFLITLYVHQQVTYDRFHRYAERIVRITMQFGPEISAKQVVVTGTRVLPEFKRTFPEIENGVRLFHDNAIVKYENKIFDEKGFAFADSSFFSVFSFSLRAGNPKMALSKPYSVILTRSMAAKYFGKERAMGKMLRIDNQQDYMVTGIIDDCPSNSQIKFNFLASFSSLEASKTEEWYDASYITYFLLHSPENIGPLQQKIDSYMKNLKDPGDLVFFLEPLLRVHLYSTLEGGFEPSGDYRYVYIFSAIALLILGIACANYINLVTARAAERAREVGVRKVMGAVRKQLIRQFLSESMIIVFIASMLGAGLVQILLPAFNTLSATQLTASSMLSPYPLTVSTLVVLTLAFLGGGYPALVLSRFNPAIVLKGNYKNSASAVLLRRTLIVFQFVISITLITSTLIIRDQLNFIQDRKPGFDTAHVLALPIDDDMRDKTRTIRNEFESHPGVRSTTVVSRTPVEVNSTNSLRYNGQVLIVNQIRTDRNFVSTTGIEIILGTDFTEADEKAAAADDANQSVMLNESAIKALNLTAEEAVGKSVDFRGHKMQVKAVIRDFHFTSMRHEIAPLIIFLGDYVSRMLVKLSGENLRETIQFMNEKWQTLVPGHPFEYEFLDEQFGALYVSEARTGVIFYAASLLAIGLACTGLLGLVSLMAQQRTKEIGIRKVLGASVANLAMLLSGDLMKLIVVAIVLTLPISYFSMQRWLDDFAYHVEPSPLQFLNGGLITLVIALVTISFQAIKTATTNPVNSLRNE